MSGLRITNEITNLDGPGPPVVQTDFAPQGHTELLAAGSSGALARVRPGQRASVRYTLDPPGAPPGAPPSGPASGEDPYEWGDGSSEDQYEWGDGGFEDTSGDGGDDGDWF